ncbi:MAG: hypothetical protein J6B50_11390 [Lachnospiraceae bacterium]|nr:hypothetical protein [Lachnospiraceae bacterium]MBP3595240.1 hypothetical protein [Lachnospiraceae bacterium]
MSYPSYEELHKAVYNFLPEKLTNGTLILEYLENTFVPSMVNIDPYKEPLPTHYSFHKIGESDSDCVMPAGASHTVRLLHYIPKNKEQQLLPDVILAAYSHAMVSVKNQSLPSAWEEPLKSYEKAAKSELKKNNYPLWHHTCKTYLPAELDYSYTSQVLVDEETAADTAKLAKHIVASVMQVLEEYHIIYHGYTEECYQQAEEYKLSLYNPY